MRSLLLCGLLFLSVLVHAQDKNRIFGKAVQRSTGAAIPNASVFISGTSLGTITDTAGNFELNGIPSGNFELIISSVTYTTIVYPFSTDKLPLKLTLQMEPKVEELTEVTVMPYDPKGWDNWGTLFLENFLGTSYAGKQCRIVNKKAVRFRYNQTTKVLSVVADEPLIIENDFLGYTLNYQLEEFTFDQANRTIFYYGYSFFKDKSENKGRVPSRYTQRRLETYNGSMAHFMRALYHDQLSAEGFELRRLVLEPNYEKERVKKIMAAQSRRNISSGGKTVLKLGLAPSADSTAYWQRVMQQANETRRYSDLLTADSVLLPAEDSMKRLSFTNYLQITYKNGLEEAAYVKSKFLSRKVTYPLSIIFLKNESELFIFPNGYYYPPQVIFSMEYWGWSEKIGRMLPIDYVAPANKN
jgi:hypothetical protein